MLMRTNAFSFAFWLLMASLMVGCQGLRQARSASFANQETSLIMAADTTVPMRVFLITQVEDSLLLRQNSQAVKPDAKDPVLQRFVKRLYRTVTDSASMGVGIAAPQVGILRDIIWVQRFDKEGFPFEVYLNPVIRSYTDLKQPCREGCLSIPNRRDTTNDRAYAILLEYDRLDGSHQVEMVEDFTAVIFQHEIDHLRGILYIDHLKQEIEDANKP
jgi:peptide deformylase